MKRAKCKRCGERPAKAPHLPLCEKCLYDDAMRAAGRAAGATDPPNVVRLSERKAAR